MNLIEKFERRSRRFFLGACVGFLALVGLVDFLSGFEMFISVLSAAAWDSGRFGRRGALFEFVHSDLEHRHPAGFLLHRGLVAGVFARAPQGFGKPGSAENHRPAAFDPKDLTLGAPVRIMFKKYPDHNLVTRVIRLASPKHVS